MSLLWLDPVGGIAGDMTLAALLDLGVDLGAVEEGLGGLRGLGFRLEVGETKKMGLRARTVTVWVGDRREEPADGSPVAVEPEEPTAGEAGADHGSAHGHGRTFPEIRDLLREAELPAVAEDVALEAFERLAHAEAAVHGTSPERVHFHEVGAVDAIVDIAGSAVAYACLGAPTVYAAAPPLGRGFVVTAHGRMPVPTPATLELMKGAPVASAQTPFELTTPTGAALLRTLAGDRIGRMPDLVPERIGCGAGTRDLPDRPNVLRAVLGEGAEDGATEEDAVLVVETNLDDQSPELLAAAFEALFAAGALDVSAAPIIMKKGRPGHHLEVILRPQAREEVLHALFTSTPTLGVRIQEVQRVVLPRTWETVSTPWGEVPVKVGRFHGRVVTRTPEFEACRRLAHEAGVPVRQVYEAALVAALRPTGAR